MWVGPGVFEEAKQKMEFKPALPLVEGCLAGSFPWGPSRGQNPLWEAFTGLMAQMLW